MPLAGHFRILILAVAVLTGLALYGVTFLRTENDLTYMIPDNNAVKIRFLDNEERFGDSVGIVLAFRSERGIYQPDLARMLEKLSQRILHLNTVLLGRRLQRVVDLDDHESILVASWLQSLVSDPAFSPDDFEQALEDAGATAESLGDFAPPLPAEVDVARLADATARKLEAIALGSPEKIPELVGAATAATDRRGNVQGQWVDRVMSLTQNRIGLAGVFKPGTPVGFAPELGGAAGLRGRGRFWTASWSAALTALKPCKKMLEDAWGLRQSGVTESALQKLRAALDPRPCPEFLAAIQEAPRQIRVAKMMDLSAPGSPGPRRLHDLALRLKAWDFFEGTLRSPDDKSTLLMIQTMPNLTKESREELLAKVRDLLAEDFGGAPYAVHEAGEAVVDHAISQSLTSDIARLLPIVVAVVAVFLFVSLHSVAGVIYPLGTVLLSTLWCLGFMGFIDLPISIVGTVLPVLLVAVGSAYGIHFVHYFSIMRLEGRPRDQVVRSAVDVTGLGVLIAGLTTVAGFGSLSANAIVALRDFGLAIAVGVGFALLLSLVLIPALLIRFGAGRVGARRRKQARPLPQSGNLYARLSGFSVKRPWWVVLAFVGILAVSGAGLYRLTVEMNNMNFFQRDSEIRRANDFINRNLAGTVGLRIIFDTGRPNGALDPALLGVLEELARRLPEDNPEVGKAVGVVDLIKKMNQAFHYNAPAHYRLPGLADLEGQQTAEALLGLYLFYVDKFSLKDRRSFVDSQKQAAVLNVQVKTGSSSVSGRINRYITTQLAGPLGEPLRRKGIGVSITGIGSLYKEASNLLITGQMWSVALSMLIVLALVTIAMRSLLFGLLSILPLSITILFNFGLMGFAGIPLDPGTAIIACVAVGIGVDYSIHYLTRYRLGKARGLTHHAAAEETASGSGKAIAINAISVAAGFLVLTLSSFVPLANLGILIALTMVLTALGSLSLLPALLTIAYRNKPRRHGHEADGRATKGASK